MPISIDNKILCTGCEACRTICPQKCIEMRKDSLGFEYPVVDNNKCVKCELCTKVCPVINSENIKKATEEDIDVYACWSLDKDTRYNSTSGGAFSELSRIVLYEGGLLVGAAYDQDCNVVHTIVSDELGLQKIRQSKYTQSKIGNVYSNVEEQLKLKKQVLFCGTPCQVTALKQFLRKDYDNLIAVDFICRGVNSPKAYRFWLAELEKKYNSKAIRVWFKYKNRGWKKSPKCTRIDFKSGSNCVQKGNKNTYMSGYLGPNMYIRPSCSDCRFKSINRCSDITLADFWGIAKELDDDQGTSLVLINTERGRKLFDRCKDNLFVKERILSEIMEGNACFEESVRINPKSEEFLRRLDKEPFSELIKKYTYVSLNKKIVNKIKLGVKKLLIK